MENAVTISEVLAQTVPIDWHEGVAIVRSLAAELMSSAVGDPEFPELNQIDVSAEGTLVLVGGRKTQEPVRRLGQLLQALLARAEPPVQLRLIISQATAHTPPFASIEDFDAALAYFERPNRTAVLQGLFARAKAAPPVAAASEPTLDTMAPLAAPAPRPKATAAPVKAAARPRKARPRALVIAAVVAVLVATAASAYIYARRTGRVDRPPIATLARQALHKVEDVVVVGLSAITERIGLGRIVFTDREEPAPPAVVAEAPVVPDNGASRSNKRNNGAVVAFDVDPDENRRMGVVHVEDVDAAIYTPDSTDVTPPVGVRPQISQKLPADTSRLVRVEILVGLDGTVESVKLIGQPRDVVESMLLSAIKAWRFSPAMKNGVPVKYRKTVWVPRE